MQKVSKYFFTLLLFVAVFARPVLSIWQVNPNGELVEVPSPQVLGRDDERPRRRRTTTVPTVRPTATIVPSATSAPSPTTVTHPTSTASPTLFIILPTTPSTLQSTVQPTLQPTAASTNTTQPTSAPVPTDSSVIQNPNQETNSAVSEPTATSVPEQKKTDESGINQETAVQSSNSWWELFTDNLLNKSVEPTNTPSRTRVKSAPKLPPPTNVLRIENNNNQVGITKVDEQGNEKKLGDQLWLEIQSQKNAFNQTNFREEQTTDVIRLGGGSNKSIIINRNNVSAVTFLPVSVDLTTNGILIETSSGIKRVTTLPDQIVQQSESAQFITSVSKTKQIELTVENGVPVYKINGVRIGKFFGIVPVSIQKQIFVSAEDGRLVKENLSISNQFLEKTSF